MAIEHISPAAEKGSSSTGNRREEGNLVPIPDEERAAPADEAPEIEIVPDEEEILG